MRVLKFGGSSVADATRIKEVCTIVTTARKDDPVLVVVSALGGVTDRLVGLIDLVLEDHASLNGAIGDIEDRHLLVLRELAPEDHETATVLRDTIIELRRLVTGVTYIDDCPPGVRDRILATGERLSAPIVAAALRVTGAPAQAVDGADIIRTDSVHGSATVDLDATRDLVEDRLATNSWGWIPVVTGFIGADRQRVTTTLGRGGSDLTATVLGAVLETDRVEIWTDVNGIFTAPPKVVAGARPQPFVSYDEAAEMARFGAAVLFSRTIAPVRELSIPVVVRNTFDPTGPATWVGVEPAVPAGARALASVERAAVLKVCSPVSTLHNTGAVAAVSSRCLIASMADPNGEWTLVADEDEAPSVCRELTDAGFVVELQSDASVLSVIGSRLLHQPWVPGRGLEALGRRNIALLGIISPSEHAFCVVVNRADHDRALAILHDALMLSHLAERAANAARREARAKGDPHTTSQLQGCGHGRKRNRAPAA